MNIQSIIIIDCFKTNSHQISLTQELGLKGFKVDMKSYDARYDFNIVMSKKNEAQELYDISVSMVKRGQEICQISDVLYSRYCIMDEC